MFTTIGVTRLATNNARLIYKQAPLNSPKIHSKSTISTAFFASSFSEPSYGVILSTHEGNTHLSHRSFSSASATAAYNQSVDEFPSLVIGSNGNLTPKGSFAEAQAQVCEM